MSNRFAEFSAAFPPCEGECFRIDGKKLAARAAQAQGVAVPDVLIEFWNAVGAGYFASREFYVFGDADSSSDREGLIDWNGNDFWRDLYSAPADGGPFFFAETCFGMQLGLQWNDGSESGYLLDVDTLQAYRVSQSCDELLKSVLSDRFAFTDPVLLSEVRSRLGVQPFGQHYAPIVSPLVGGTLKPGNHHFETPNVHLRTSIATWKVFCGK